MCADFVSSDTDCGCSLIERRYILHETIPEKRNTKDCLNKVCCVFVYYLVAYHALQLTVSV